MRAVILSLTLTLLVSPALALSAASGCDSAATEKAKHKPSSYAPHPKTAQHSYGAPVGAKVLSKHAPKKKPASA